MRITGTFLDEISYDIPHQNWGRREWRRDFLNMRAIGIDTVINDAKACLLATETWPFAVEKAVFYTAICGILHYLMPPQAVHT
ncbi:MAG: hypothetical protein DBX90_01925, partial [Lentisphaerae bacterium]